MRPPLGYDEAVRKIYDRIQAHRAKNEEWPWQNSTDDVSVLRNILTHKGKWYLERNRDALFERSVSDRRYYDMLRFALAEKIFLSLKLEADEADWVAKALAGEHDVPTYTSRAYTTDSDVRKFGLHALVVDCVHVLRRRGLRHRLACDAVAEACGKHHLDVRSASTVADIWKRQMPALYRRATNR